MKPQIRILETAGNSLKLDFVWSKEDNTFELPSKSETENPESFHYFWYFSDGTYSLDPRPQPVFNNTANQVYESGLLLLKKKKKGPVVRGKASPTPKPPVDPYDKTMLYVHVEASEKQSEIEHKGLSAISGAETTGDSLGNSNSSTTSARAKVTSPLPTEIVSVNPNILNDSSAIQLESIILENMMVAVVKYTRLESLKADGYLRISMNLSSGKPPLMMQQKPILFNNEWVDLASPADNYLQAIQIGFKDMAIGETRALFIPFWALYSEDETTDPTTPILRVDNEVQVEWLTLNEDGLLIEEAHTVLLDTTPKPDSQ